MPRQRVEKFGLALAVLLAPACGLAQSSQSYTNLIPANNYVLIANQLDHGSNTLNEVLTNLPVCTSCGDNLTLYKYSCQGGWQSVQYYDSADLAPSAGWYDASLNPSTWTLSPGEGAAIRYSPAGGGPNTLTLRFTGNPHVPVLPPTAMFTCGYGTYYLLSRETNAPGSYESITGFFPQEGATVVTGSNAFLGTFNNSNTFTAGAWTLGPPNLAVGESAFFRVSDPTQTNTLNLSAGYSLIANQLDHGSNRVSEIMPVVPDGCTISKFNNANRTWSVSTYYASLNAWVPADVVLKPGEGAFLKSPTNFALTFTGTPHVPVLPIPGLTAGVASLLSRQTNDLGSYDNILGISATNGARVFKWNPTIQSFTIFTYAANHWSPSDPSAAVGESLWLASSSSSTPSLPPSYTVTVPAGTSWIANQLDHGSNTLSDLLPVVPAGSFFGTWDCNSNALYFGDYYDASSGTWFNASTSEPSGTTLLPGQGGAISNGGSSFQITFTGNPHVPVLPLTLPCGYGVTNFVSCQSFSTGTFENITGRLPSEGAAMQLFNGGFVQTYAYGSGAWTPSTPSIPLGQPVLLVVAQPNITSCVNLICSNSKTVSCSSAWSFNLPTFTDPCCGTNVTISVFNTVTNGACPAVITRTWVATNCAGSTASCSQTVTVVDTNSPTITCATNKTVAPGTAWSFDAPSATDNCCTNVTITVLSTITNLASCSQVITRRWQASDCCGNTSSCSQTVTVASVTTVISASGGCGDSQLSVAFSGPVSASSATNVTHYQLSCGGALVAVTSALLGSGSANVSLYLAQPLSPVGCSLAITGLVDTCSNTIPGYQSGLTCTPDPCSYNSAGTEFWLTFPGNYAPDPAAPPQPQLYITGAPGAIGTVSMPGLATPFNASFTLPASGAYTVTLPKDADLANANDLVQTNAVHVISSSRVSVYAMNHVAYTSDGYLGLPVKALGASYLVLGFKNVFTGVPELNGSQFAIASAADNTTVTIIPSVNAAGHTAQQSFNITLMKGWTYQLRATNDAPADLSGSIILADQPIAVFGSHQCAVVPAATNFFCDHLVEQLPPTQVWGTNFLTLPLATRSLGDIVRIMALVDGTAVNINGVALSGTINKGGFFEIEILSACHLTANHPVLVAQYANSSDYDFVTTADPFMVLIPPTPLFSSNYLVQCPASGFSGNYLNITVPSGSESQVVVDTSTLAANLFSPIPTSTFLGARVPVTPGTHSVHTANNASFGLIVYGWNEYDGYGFPGGTCGSANATPPSFSCPPTNVFAQTGSNCLAQVPDLTTQVGNTNAALRITQTPTAGTLVGPGSHTITVTIVDLLGGSHTCVSTLTVTPGAGAGLVCPPNIATNCDSSGKQRVSYQVALCNPAFTLTCTPASGSLFNPGATTVFCIATNGLGASSSCTFTVTVTCVTISIASVSGGLTLTWPGTATLQKASSPVGPWITVTNAVSPYTFSFSPGQAFFRVKQ